MPMTHEAQMKGAAGNKLRRLRRMAEELQQHGWDVKEPKDAINVVLDQMIWGKRDEA